MSNHSAGSFERRGGYRGSRGGRGRGGRGDRLPVRAPEVSAPSAPDTLKPQFLSTTPSELSDEPSWLADFELEGAGHSVPVKLRIPLFVEDGGLIDLAIAEYRKVSATNRAFRRTISEGMYLYYISNLALARRLLLERCSRVLTDEESEILEEISPSTRSLTKLSAAFLAGIGDVTTRSGDKLISKTGVWPNREVDSTPGYYSEELDSDTYYWYMYYIAPGVCLDRICADLAFTHGIGGRNWKPGFEADVGDYTENFVGWRPAEKLNPEIVSALENLGFTCEEEEAEDGEEPDRGISFPVFDNNYGVLPALLSYIDSAVRNLNKEHNIVIGVPANVTGSPGQIPFIAPEGKKTYPRFPLGKSEIMAFEFATAHNLTVALIDAFRVRRDGKGWYPFSTVGDTWYSNRNTLLERTPFLNVVDFRQPDKDRAAVINAVVAESSKVD